MRERFQSVNPDRFGRLSLGYPSYSAGLSPRGGVVGMYRRTFRSLEARGLVETVRQNGTTFVLLTPEGRAAAEAL